jgi:hypothetical protein
LLFRFVESSNEQILGSYRNEQTNRHSQLERLISDHVVVQSDYCGQARSGIDQHAGRRADERTQLTSKYAETVSHLIQTMGDIERVTSDQMYSEQSWVEQLLKRVRNEADSATNDFHGYLVDQLLTVSTKILSALQKQDKSVQVNLRFFSLPLYYWLKWYWLPEKFKGFKLDYFTRFDLKLAVNCSKNHFPQKNFLTSGTFPRSCGSIQKPIWWPIGFRTRYQG